MLPAGGGPGCSLGTYHSSAWNTKRPIVFFASAFTRVIGCFLCIRTGLITPISHEPEGASACSDGCGASGGRQSFTAATPAGGLAAGHREALGMTSAGLAARLEITASGVRKLEQAESTDAITLGTLRRVAEALDCDLQYTLVPRRPLREMRRQQALRLAKQ